MYTPRKMHGCTDAQFLFFLVLIIAVQVCIVFSCLFNSDDDDAWDKDEDEDDGEDEELEEVDMEVVEKRAKGRSYGGWERNPEGEGIC